MSFISIFILSKFYFGYVEFSFLEKIQNKISLGEQMESRYRFYRCHAHHFCLKSLVYFISLSKTKLLKKYFLFYFVVSLIKNVRTITIKSFFLSNVNIVNVSR